ncbi:MAG: KTSC domain-containing protein, partial [Nitrospiraceae bacterium]
RHPVSSSTLRSAAYDPDHRTLILEYQGGSVYHYFHVPEHVFEELMKEDSKGRFVNYRIKPYYRYKEIGT